jgi:hypothetical protein
MKYGLAGFSPSKKMLRNAAIVLAIAIVAYVVMYGVREGFQETATVLDALPTGPNIIVIKKDLQLSPEKSHTISSRQLIPYSGKIKDIEFYLLTKENKWKKIMNPKFDKCGTQDITATMQIGASIVKIKKPGTAVCPGEKVQYRMGEITDEQANKIKASGFMLNRVEVQNIPTDQTQSLAVTPRPTPQNRTPKPVPVDNIAIVIHFM